MQQRSDKNRCSHLQAVVQGASHGLRLHGLQPAMTWLISQVLWYRAACSFIVQLSSTWKETLTLTLSSHVYQDPG